MSAATFAAALRRAMGARPRKVLYQALGVDSTSARNWLTGRVYPDHDSVVAMADLLHAPELVAISVRDRTGTCDACGLPTFATRGPEPPRFCTARCRRRVADRRSNGRRLVQDRKVLRYRLEEHVEAVAAYCEECSGAEHVCRDGGCRLRSVSPLPFIPLAAIPTTKAA